MTIKQLVHQADPTIDFQCCNCLHRLCEQDELDLCMCENSSHFFTDVSYNETCEYWEPNWDYLPNKLEYLADVEVDEMEKS